MNLRLICEMNDPRRQMPVYLKDKSEFPELERFKSVLIVPCRFFTAASMAVRKNKPYFVFIRLEQSLKLADHIHNFWKLWITAIESDITGIFTSHQHIKITLIINPAIK